MTSTFEVASKFKDVINEINWEKITSPVMETDDQINDYGDYAVIDNFLQFPDEFVDALSKCPADFLDIVAKQTHAEIGKFPYGAKDPGVHQLLVPHYLVPMLFGFYKACIDCEFIPADLNTNLEGEGMKRFLNNLPGYCSTVANLMYPGCVNSVGQNVPTFDRWDYSAVLFLNDSPDSTFNLYDLEWNGKYYANAEDLMEEKGEVLEDIAQWLNTNATAKEESEEYKRYAEGKEGDHFIQTRSVEVVKNRLVILKGNQFRLTNYSGNGELYQLQIGMNDIPKPKEMDGNEFRNDEVYS